LGFQEELLKKSSKKVRTECRKRQVDE